jgi:hypothetical protein
VRYTFRLPAGPHTRFAPDAWASAIGQSVATPDGIPGQVVAAEIVEDGAAVKFTVEADLPGEDRLLSGLSINPDGEDGAR